MDRETARPQVRELPGKRAQKWVSYHQQTAAPSTYVYDFVWDITADAEGPFCTDVDGNVLMDFTSHVGAAPLGYNNPKLMEKLERFDLVDPMKIAGQDFYVAGAGTPDDPQIPGPAVLMDRLTDITAHYDMDTVFLSNSGAEAVENAIKICYDNSGGAKYGLTFQGAFHGRTLGALSLNRSKEVYRRHYPEIAGIHDAPFCSDRTCTPDSCDCGFFVENTSTLRKRLHPKKGHINPEEVAYLIMEPVQGEGGYNIPSDAFMQEIADVCAEYNITLIADEIQSGIGRTGKLWASDHYPITPDVITCAKGLRVGATVSRSDVFPAEKGRISSTWGAGDILGAMQGTLTLDAIEQYDLLSNATARGEQLKEQFADAENEKVVDVRGLGLMLAVELDSRERRDAVINEALKRGLLILGCGYKTVRLLPPLDVTEREMALGADLLLEAINAA
ncbi:aminotransferase class III-fold pyridoxal phosphate-dependent enzyme [Haladaptatus sp. CMSO5]|uniref:aminotransferase class III-fold pyridoxal phosphate-dependent enzyme n=1 Tax=Haladaptatus sp. CMSO5 TaxID=3120514 RepID=UPI002FCE2C0C